MDQIASDQHLVRCGILHYFHAGISRDDAIIKALKSHQSCPLIFPIIDYRDVEFWYKSFGEGNYDLNQTPIHPVLSKLESLPVLGHVIHLLNIKDQLSMRRVCKTFKFFIDVENLIIPVLNFYFSVTNDSVVLQLRHGKDHSWTYFDKRDEGCIVKKNDVSTKCDMNFIKAGRDAFKKAVKARHTKVKIMHVLCNSKLLPDECRRDFICGVAAVLNGLPHKLHDEYLDLVVRFPNELDDILSRIRPGSLVALGLNYYSNEMVSRLSEVESFSLHLPNLVRLSIENITDMKLDSFMHIPQLSIKLGSMTPEAVRIHKDKLLQFPKLKSHTLHSRNIDMGLLKNALQPYTPISEEPVVSGSYPIPGDTEHLLVFDITRNHNGWISITFQRMVLGEVMEQFVRNIRYYAHRSLQSNE